VHRDALARLWRQAGYRRLQVSATLARLANEMFPVGAVLLVLDRTGSAALAGASVAAFALPSVASGPFLGAWLDRRARPVALIALDQALSFAGLVGLAFAATGGWAAVLSLSFVAGVSSPLSYGALTSLLPALVERETLGEANAVEAASFNAAVVGGPTLAGVAVATAGPFAAVIAQAALKLAALGLLLRVRGLPLGVPPITRSLGRLVIAGVRHVVGTAPLLAVTTAGAVALSGRGLLTVAFPLFAAGQLATHESFAAYLWAAFALGSIAGIAALSGPTARLPPERTTLAATALSGATMLLWPLAGAPTLALALVGLSGFAYGPGLAATFAVRQRWTPAGLRGQVFTTSASLKPASFAVGAAVAGPLTLAVGAPGTLAVAGGAHLLGSGVGSLLLARRPSAPVLAGPG
jgi:hypothetical protein